MLKEIQHLKTSLLEKCLIKDLGNLKYFQGIEFSRSRKEIFISQRKSALDIFQETHYKNTSRKISYGAKSETFSNRRREVK